MESLPGTIDPTYSRRVCGRGREQKETRGRGGVIHSFITLTDL